MARAGRQDASRDAVIGRTTRVRGRVSGDGDLVVEGTVEGDVRASGPVTIEAGARVRGDLRGDGIAIEEGAEYVGRLEADFELPAELGGTSGGRRR